MYQINGGPIISNLLSGSCAGVIAYAVVYPLDLVKTMISINKAKDTLSIFGNIFDIARTKGVRALYRGLGTTCFGIFPYAGFKFGFYEEFKRMGKERSGNKTLNAIENLVFGGLAGCCAVTITYPTDVMRRKRQAQIIRDETKNMSYLQLLRKVWVSEGWRGFYKGLAVTYYKVIPSVALTFAINETMKKALVSY